MKILSKKHSASVIKKLNLNRVPEVVCDIYEEDVIVSFCEKFVEKTYILRDVQNPSGKYFLCHNKEECLISAKNYEGPFSLAVSCFAYENIVLLGEICLTKENITIVASDDKTVHHRNVYQKAIINKKTTLDDDSIWDVDGVEDIIKYVVDHNLYDVIIEFVVYDKPVGVNNNKVLITELRSDY
jgi:hypothetical protein